MTKLAILFAVVGATAACNTAIRPVLTSPEQKVWVIKGEDEVYRCADGAAVDQPPNPVCIRARLIEGTK
jgi:hypothetical protein